VNRQKFRGSTTAALPPFSGRAARVGYFFDLALDFFVDLAAFDFAGVEEQPELLQPQDDFFMAMVTFSKCGSGPARFPRGNPATRTRHCALAARCGDAILDQKLNPAVRTPRRRWSGSSLIPL
jgi:hypothetical protein